MGTVVFGSQRAARADTPTPEQLSEQIRQLQSKVAALEAQRPATRPAVPPASTTSPNSLADLLRSPPPSNVTGNDVNPIGGTDPINSTVRQPTITTAPTLPGAEPTLSPITGGWNGTQFSLRSSDGNFSLHPGLTLDVRDSLDYRTRVPAGAAGGGLTNRTGYDTENGVDLSRLRLTFDGSLFRQFSYFFQFSADGGQSLALLDASVTYQIADSPFSLKAGQFKDPVWHERNVAESNLMAVDRSLVEFFLAGGQGSRVQGGAVTYDAGRVRGQLVAHDGFNTQNTHFFDAGGDGVGVGGAAGVTPTDYGFSGRAEYMLLGTRSPRFNPFTEYDQFTSLGARQDILVAGVGADYSQAGANDLVLHSADLQYNNVNGFSAYAAYVGSYRGINTNQGVPAGYYYDPAFLVQVAWVFDNRYEPFVRYDYVKLDPDSTRAIAGGLRSHLVQELTVGTNVYLVGQKLKLTFDGSFLPNGSPADADALGVLKDSGHAEFVGRAQLQLAI